MSPKMQKNTAHEFWGDQFWTLCVTTCNFLKQGETFVFEHFYGCFAAFGFYSWWALLGFLQLWEFVVACVCACV